MVIRFIREELWTHVVRGPYECAGHVVLVFQHSGDAKVSNLDDVGLCQEDVLCFKVPVKNVPLMQVLQHKFTTATSNVTHPYEKTNPIMSGPTYLQCHGYLDKPLHHLPLR